MKINILTKNYKVSDRLEENIEKKFDKLDKFFHEDVTANVVVSKFKDLAKIEATINAKQAVFRAEAAEENVYDAMDIVLDKLANQMSKLKGKLQERYHENKALKFEFIPDFEEDEPVEEQIVVKRKQFELQPMGAEEAILQMEMLGHDFFVYLDMDTDSVNVVYKRKGNAYGVIETIR
ncbi:MAG: ribosome-associated translation inhibitor RaiA [Firmicutes bacterium]|nr:ribosome-associated translation inhibitor RaiA [Bacillota bacterium]